MTLNLKKVFFEYSSIVLLEQIVDAFDLIIVEEKLVAIVNLTFSLTLKKLKVYLNLIDYLRVYVSWYAQIFLSLQERKTLLLKDDFVKSKLEEFLQKESHWTSSSKRSNDSTNIYNMFSATRNFFITSKTLENFSSMWISLKKKHRRDDFLCQRRFWEKDHLESLWHSVDNVS